MAIEHTPGTWEQDIGYDELDEHTFRCIIHTSNDYLQPAHVFGRTIEECEANARLVSSAPKMLTALEEMLNLFNPIIDSRKEGEQEDLIHKAQELIDKIKGGGR